MEERAPHPMQRFQRPLAPPGPQTNEHGRGRHVPHECGIAYRGPWETAWSGVEIAVRRHARALADAGIPVFLQSGNHRMVVDGDVVQADPSLIELSVMEEVGGLLEPSFFRTVLAIRHSTLSPQALAAIVSPRRGLELPDMLQSLRSGTIVNTVFERACLDEDLRLAAVILAGVADVWVPCSRNRRLLVEAGMPADRVAVVPHPLPDRDPLWTCRRKARKGRRYRFLNVGKWEPRKAQHELLGAFLLAFGPGEAELVLKTSAFGRWKDYLAGPGASADAWLADPRVARKGWTRRSLAADVTLITAVIPRESMVALHASCDCYVSSSRAEGFDLPAFDAKAMGLAMIYSKLGGPEDFAMEGDIALEGEAAPAHRQYGWCQGAMWSGHSIDEMSSAMLAMAFLRTRGEWLDMSPYTMRSVGRLMRERCELAIERNGGEARW